MRSMWLKVSITSPEAWFAWIVATRITTGGKSSRGKAFISWHELKSNDVYDEIRRRVGRRSKNVVDDETIKLKGIQTPFRLIHYISPDDQHEYHFITNAMHLSAQTIADIYKERWQIELFFKWVKQNLKIKTFLGTSTNAVMTQVWVALCLYLILAFIRFISKTVHSMREILNWIRINLFSNEILDDYLVPKMTEPSVNPQFALFWKVVGQQWHRKKCPWVPNYSLHLWWSLLVLLMDSISRAIRIWSRIIGSPSRILRPLKPPQMLLLLLMLPPQMSPLLQKVSF